MSANQKHVEMLEQGVEAWNQWRREKENYYLFPDLGLTDLSGKDLRGFNLGFADLTEANLRGSNLGGAYLGQAFLDGADLSEACLIGTNLGGAQLVNARLNKARLNLARLIEANLQGADLSSSILVGTIFSQASLEGANLQNAELGDTTMGNTNLSGAKGLNACIHKGPSIIDTGTLAKSGIMPVSFLRGCGVPDAFINYLPSLINTPVHFYSCFISYSSRDGAFANRLYADLQDSGVRCWFAPEDLRIGDKTRVQIDESIRVYDKLLIILSEHSVESQWVEKEVESALEKERSQKRIVLFPIRLDDTVMNIAGGWPADIRRTRKIGDFKKWKDYDSYQKAFDRLIRDLQAEESSKNHI